MTSTDSDRTLIQSYSSDEKHVPFDSASHLQLHSAACMGDLPLVHALVEKGIDINAHGELR
jgi:ankyrin repeat protein